MRSSRALGALGALGLWLACAPAAAWVQTQTCSPQGPYLCEPGQAPQGLFWPAQCVTWHVHQGGLEGLAQAPLVEAIEAGFGVWGEPTCSYLTLRAGGMTDEVAIGFDQTNPSQNVNAVQFQEDWVYGRGILALTSVTYGPVSGVIYDADMELNAADFVWSLSEAGDQGRIDVTNTVAHEAGHFLGLDHTGVEAATMHASAPPGEVSKRSLDPDDIEGLCAIYPAGAPVDEGCLGAPAGFYTSQRGAEMEQTSPPAGAQADEGCGCAVTPRAGSGGWLALCALALGVALRRRGALALLALGVVAAAPSPASAYVRTQTCNPNGGPLRCAPGESPREIFWPASCVVYHINEAGSEDTDNERAFVAIESSFQRWTLPDCSYISFVNGGFTDEDRIGYNSYTGSGQNANIVVFRDQAWEHESGILALTSVTYRPSTGEIVDADIELNGVDYNFTTTNNELRVIIDVANTITHEAGHFLGLDHSQAEEATMFATAPIRETKKRSLDLDDINGLCAIYPASQRPASDVCVGGPVGFFQRPLYGPNDGAPPAEARRCACSTPSRPWSLRGAGALLAVAALALRRRRAGGA